MKKFLFFNLFILVAVCLTAMSWGNHKTPEEIYKSWKFSLEQASIDSVTVRYRIQAEAREMLSDTEVSEEIYYGILGLQLAEASPDEIIRHKETIVKNYPASQACFDIAREDFFDQIYPVWNDDHEKVIIIEKLLQKYTNTPWRRTMYQYLCYSLANIADKTMLQEQLGNWREEFSQDYLPWYVSAANYQTMDSSRQITLEMAEKAYQLSINPNKPQYYPQMEWELERRSARIRSAYLLAEILISTGELDQASLVINNTLQDNSLGIDDETTLGRLYLAQARIHQQNNELSEAINACSEALIQGDSRNVYTPQADSLLQELTSNKSTLSTSRNALSYSDVIFSDVTRQAGLADISGSRIAWGDYDQDGWEDFLLSSSRLYRNLEGKKFVDVTPDVFDEEIKFGGALWGDVDNDGDLDIVTKDPENIWLNSAGRFQRFEAESEYADNGVSSEGMALGDVNQDGILDIYLANYEGESGEYFHDQLFLGKGNGTFEENTYSAGTIAPDDKKLAGRGVNMGDFNNDGLLDIYVSNYRLTQNLLFVNQGKGSFLEKSEILGVSGENTEGWWGHTIGSEWGDIDNDGDFDLITCNLAHPRYIDFSNKTKLYINEGAPNYSFYDIRADAGIRYEETNSEPAWADFDNDGYLDLYITNVYEGRRSFLYMNNQDYTFREVTWLSGTRHFNGWGSACCDYDKDGDLDLLVAGGNIQLFKNITRNDNNWLEIEVKPAPGSNAIGTRITIEGRDLILTRQIQGGKGTTNQHSMVQHFGLGSRKSGLTLTVVFPSGVIRSTTVKEVNNRYLIKEVK